MPCNKRWAFYDTCMNKLWDIIKIVGFAILIVIPIQYFFIRSFEVNDDAMLLDFQKGDVILLSRIAYFTGALQRNDVIVFRDSQDISKEYLRRVIGMPGERVVMSDGILSIRSGKETSIREIPLYGSVVTAIKDIGNLDAHEYFVFSDAEPQLPLGMIDKRFIVGKPIIRIFPLQRFKIFY